MTKAIDTKTLALAAEHAELLQAIGDNGASPAPLTKTELAALLKRDPSNLNKTLKILGAAGLVHADGSVRGLPGPGEAALVALDRAAAAFADEPGSSQGGIVFLYWSQIAPDPQNARRDWDSGEAIEELKALRDDILANDLLQNLVVRGPGQVDPIVKAVDDEGRDLPIYTLIGGERRWRAIGMALKAGDWAEDRLIPCRLLETDDLGHKLAGLAENLQRRNLNPIEKAKAFEGLSVHLSNAEIAEKVGCTPEHVQQHRRFLKLSEKDQSRMALPSSDPNHLSIRDARYALNSIKGPPEKLPRDQELIILELYWLAAIAGKDGGYWGSDVEVAPNAIELGGGAMAALRERGWLWVGETPSHRDGRFYARLSWVANNWVADAHPKLTKGKKEARAKALHMVQAPELKGECPYSSGPIGQAFLQGPFELTPEGKAIAEAAEAAAAERARAAAESEKERVAREEAWCAARAASSAVPVPVAPAGHGGVAELRAVAEVFDLPLPWAVNERAELVAANGKVAFATRPAWGPADDRAIALATLGAIALNAAGGHATPEGPDRPDEAKFVGWMAGRLQLLIDDLTPEAGIERAKTLLAEFLSDNGIAFGDDDYDWSSDGAAELVNDSLELEQAA